jgi:hypothetical protein
MLSTGNPAVATTPVSVRVPEKDTTATFTISTATVRTLSSTPITATHGTAVRSATLTVLPPPLSPAFKVYRQGVGYQGFDIEVCTVKNSVGEIDCVFDASLSRGFPTKYIWTLKVESRDITFTTTVPELNPPTTCALYEGARMIGSYVPMDVQLRVERNDEGPAGGVASKTLRVSAALSQTQGYCGFRLP